MLVAAIFRFLEPWSSFDVAFSRTQKATSLEHCGFGRTILNHFHLTFWLLLVVELSGKTMTEQRYSCIRLKSATSG